MDSARNVGSIGIIIDKKMVLAIYPLAVIKMYQSIPVVRYYVSDTASNTILGFLEKTREEAWRTAAQEIKKQMMEKLEK